MEKSPKEIQEEVFSLIRNLHSNNWKSKIIQIVPMVFLNGDGTSDIDRYHVIYESGDMKFKFTTSRDSGIWGIDSWIKVDEIMGILMEDIRDEKILEILKDGK